MTSTPRSLKDISFAAVALVIVLGSLWLWLAPVQAKAPDVRLQTLDGQLTELSERRGKPTLLAFWATTCSTCVKEMPDLAALHQRYQAQGFSVYGVAMSYDPIEQVSAMVQEKQLPYPIVHDLDGQIALAFDEVRLTPTLYLIDPKGNISNKIIGIADFSALSQQISAMLQQH